MPDDTRGTAGKNRYPDDQREAVYRVIEERRDVRRDFRPDPVPADVLKRVLEPRTAHRPSACPSRGTSSSSPTGPAGQRIAALAERPPRRLRQRPADARARAFDRLKIEAILDTPVNIVVTCDPTRGGRHTLGRHTQPQTAAFSSVLAVANLWLAARAEGLGVGWVSFFDERELAAELDLPTHLEVVAYLCVGYVTEFAPEPELAPGRLGAPRPVSLGRARRGVRPPWTARRRSRRPLEKCRRHPAARPGSAGGRRQRQDRMTKPRGSLGQPEETAIKLAGLAGACPPPLPGACRVAVFAADHGVHAQGVTPWPQEVTAQMVANFLAGGAVVNAFAAQAGAEVTSSTSASPPTWQQRAQGCMPRKIAKGTSRLHRGPAMTRDAGRDGDTTAASRSPGTW